MKIKLLQERLKRQVVIKVYIPFIMMVIALVVGLVGMTVLQSYYMAGVGTGAVTALAILGIFKNEIK